MCRAGTDTRQPCCIEAPGRAGLGAGATVPEVRWVFGGAQVLERAALPSSVTWLLQGPPLAVSNYKFNFICQCRQFMCFKELFHSI